MISDPRDMALFRQGVLAPAWPERMNALIARLEEQERHGTAPVPNPFQDAMPRASRIQALRADLAEMRVVANDGDVRPQRGTLGGWVQGFAGKGGPVFWSVSGYPMPITGAWRVYMLPRSRVAVGAEAWGADPAAPGQPTAEHVARYREVLFAAQGIDPGSLAELRAGRAPAGLAASATTGGLFGSLFGGGAPAAGARLSILDGAPRLTVWESYSNGRRLQTYRMELAGRELTSASNPILHGLFDVLANDFPLRAYLASEALLAVEPLGG